MTTIISISVVQIFLSCRSAFKGKGKKNQLPRFGMTPFWEVSCSQSVPHSKALLVSPQEYPTSCEVVKCVLKITSYPEGDTKIKSTNIHRIVILAQAHRG